MQGSSSRTAVASADGRTPLTHSELREFVLSFDLSRWGLRPGDRCACMLPNGPELSVAVLSISARCCVFPVNPQNTASEIETDMRSVNAKAMIVQQGQKEEHLLQVARSMGIPIIRLVVDEQKCGVFVLDLHPDSPATTVAAARDEEKKEQGEGKWTPRHGNALVLHTSGTSGKKKVTARSLCLSLSIILLIILLFYLLAGGAILA